jgi:arginine decarboxylase
MKKNLSASGNEKFSTGALVGNRIPKDYFITKGVGESDITIHAGSYHLALRKAGIEMCNHITYSSILPGIANEVKKPRTLTHGSVMENISAVANAANGQRATAGIIFGWLYDRKTKKKFGGLVCEYNGHGEAEIVKASLRDSLEELYQNGYDKKYELKNEKLIMESFIPEKSYGTALVAICFLNYFYPVIKKYE